MAFHKIVSTVKKALVGGALIGASALCPGKTYAASAGDDVFFQNQAVQSVLCQVSGSQTGKKNTVNAPSYDSKDYMLPANSPYLPAYPVIDGMCYSGFRGDQDPNQGVYPTPAEIKDDLSDIALFSDKIRTYSNAESLSQVPSICTELNLDCYIGAWVSKYDIESKKEVDNLIRIAKSATPNVKGLIVGNEVLLRKDIPKTALIEYIKKVNDSTTVPVGTADTWQVLLDNPDVVGACDFVLAHIHPYWEGIAADKAAADVAAKYSQLKAKYPGALIMIGETGFPSQGEKNNAAIPSPQAQSRFFGDFLQIANREKIPYFYFCTFDETWKKREEGVSGANWGIFDADGNLKAGIKQYFPDPLGVRQGHVRQASPLEKKTVTAPVWVYYDGEFEANLYQPTGYMGAIDAIVIDRNCAENPHSGKSCTKVTLDRKNMSANGGWAGVYWQYPINNWGDYAGIDIKGASKLVFFARSDDGAEAQFKFGGINCMPYESNGKKFKDSVGPLETNEVIVPSAWTQYAIDLKGKDLSNIIGGFCWVTNQWSSKDKITLYLDDIRIE